MDGQLYHVGTLMPVRQLYVTADTSLSLALVFHVSLMHPAYHSFASTSGPAAFNPDVQLPSEDIEMADLTGAAAATRTNALLLSPDAGSSSRITAHPAAPPASRRPLLPPLETELPLFSFGSESGSFDSSYRASVLFRGPSPSICRLCSHHQ